MVTVIIPTNRFHCIENVFKQCINNYNGNLFRFEIHDSSIDNDIENLYKKYKKKNIYYYKYNRNISVDEKAIAAINRIKTSFFWLMGDGILPDFNSIEKIIQKSIILNIDILTVDTANRIGYLRQDTDYLINKIYIFKDPVKYAKKYFSKLTFWGASIIKTSFYLNAFSEKILGKYHKYSIPWWIAGSLFDIVNIYYRKKRNFKLGVVYTNFISYNPEKKDHWWTSDEKYYVYVFLKFNLTVNLLPKLYDSEKEYIIYFFRNDTLVNTRYLLELREKNILNYKTIQKYKREIINVKGFYYKMLFFSFIPVRIAHIVCILKSIIKQILKNFRGEAHESCTFSRWFWN